MNLWIFLHSPGAVRTQRQTFLMHWLHITLVSLSAYMRNNAFAYKSKIWASISGLYQGGIPLETCWEAHRLPSQTFPGDECLYDLVLTLVHSSRICATASEWMDINLWKWDNIFSWFSTEIWCLNRTVGGRNQWTWRRMWNWWKGVDR